MQPTNTQPDDYDVLFSMLARGVNNHLAGRGVNLNANPLGQMVFNKGAEFLHGYLRPYYDMLVSNPPQSINAGCEVIKEEVCSHVDDFGEKLKARMQNKEQ